MRRTCFSGCSTTPRFQIYPARSVREAEGALAVMSPAAVILDLVLGDDDGWGLLKRLKDGDERKPAVVVVGSARWRLEPTHF